MRLPFIRPFVAALARRKSIMTILMILLCRIVNVQGNLACTQCILANIRCTGDCSRYAGTASLSSCARVCSIQNTVCTVANCVGGVGPAVDDDISEEQQAFLNVCGRAISVANANGDAYLTVDEFKAQTTAWTESFCPERNAATAVNFYDDAKIQTFFATLSCVLCFGLLDPHDPKAREADFHSCGCTSATNALPIYTPAQTAVEGNSYCVLAFEIVFVQCEQPQPSCLQACQAEREACVNDVCGSFDGPDFYVKCVQTCDPPFYPCVQACDKIV